MIEKEENTTVSRICEVMELGRSQYYRMVRGMRDYQNRQSKASESCCEKLIERAEALAKKYTFYGHRKIHALLLREEFKTSRYQVYKLLQRKKLCLPSTWRKELRERSRALKQYLIKPQRPLELLQADITHVPVDGYGTYYVINIIDYYSKYVLASVFADRHSTDVLIGACNEALREAKDLGLDIPSKPLAYK